MFLEIFWRGIVESEGCNELLAYILGPGFSADGQQGRGVAPIGLGCNKRIPGSRFLSLDVAGIFCGNVFLVSNWILKMRFKNSLLIRTNWAIIHIN